MSELDKLTKEVPSSFTSSTKQDEKRSLNDLIDELKTLLSVDEKEKFIQGVSYQGLKKSNGTEVLRNLIDSYISAYSLLETNDNQSRLVNNKIKSSLQKQSDHIFDQLALCKDDPNSLLFILGAVLKCLSNRN